LDVNLSRHPTTFEAFLDESILEGMRRTLGENGARSVIFHVNLKPTFADPKELHFKFETLFGKSGAKRIEQVIISDLYLSLGLPFGVEDPINDWDTFDFEKCAAYASHSFQQRKTAGANRLIPGPKTPEQHGSYEKCTYIEYYYVSGERLEHHCDLREGHSKAHTCDQGRRIGTHPPESD
jgi:hypothetical protein